MPAGIKDSKLSTSEENTYSYSSELRNVGVWRAALLLYVFQSAAPTLKTARLSERFVKLTFSCNCLPATSMNEDDNSHDDAMARCRCNGRLLCMCLLPCMMTFHLFVYVMVSVFVTVSYTPPPIVVHYVAPGASGNTSALASHPLGPFWNLRLEEGALWNRLQHAWDRQNNPILRRGGKMSGATAPRKNCTSFVRLADTPDDLLRDLPEQMRAFIWSMHRRKYPLLIDRPGTCGANNASVSPPMLLMAIKSQVGNFENRQAIRETWGRSGLVRGEAAGGKGGLVRTVFLLGRQDAVAGPHPDLGSLLELESQQHEDILQWDFTDTFFNLTLKDLLVWRWVQTRCPRALFVFKGDDDVFVRTGALLDYLHGRWEEHSARQAVRNGSDDDAPMELIVGDVISNARPNREPAAKYYIPESFYKGVYPPYAGGGGVVYSGSLVARLREVSERVQLFPIDDVYLGMCLHRLGLSPVHHQGFLTFDLPESERDKSCAYRSVLLVHKRSPKEMLTLWKQLQTPPPPC